MVLLGVEPRLFARLLQLFLQLRLRGAIEIKGKGEMETWLLTGRRGDAAAVTVAV